MILKSLSLFVGVSTALQPLPPVRWTAAASDTTGGFDIGKVPRTIYLAPGFANHTDAGGLTLIPPSAREFAETFRADLSQLFGSNWTVVESTNVSTAGITLGSFRGNASQLTYENGIPTEEGYEIEVSNGRVFVGGTGARGLFWGTRTLIQELLIANGSAIPAGRVVDAPAYATRGYMLDAGRKWYAPSFLKELCTYASFFKMSEFHYHSSDNYPLNRGNNATWNKVFSHFSLYPENPDLQGIIERKNETLSRADFEDFQKHCAQRGVTVIPEIEAPGHALAITKWKPELALAKKDLLNLTHPDAIPTVKAIWAEFMPWFQTKEIHIGADEYDPLLADDYLRFVNEMSRWVNATSGKKIRIWGTHEPSENLTVSKDIVVQHWQYGQSDPLELHSDGYEQVNSEDWWGYMSLKNDHTPILPATYPQFFNVTRTLNFANVPGWQWDPSLVNPVNLTSQLPPGASGNRGAILAAWNDNGADATTQLEAYYAMREGIPVAAARSWTGRRGPNITASTLPSTLSLLLPQAPGQNLDRRFPSPSSPLLSWAPSSAPSPGRGSYGPPYTLTLNATSPFTLSGPDTTLALANLTTDASTAPVQSLLFTTNDNFPYPLRSVDPADGLDPGHPGRIWTNASTSTHAVVPVRLPAVIRVEADYVNGTRVWVDGVFAGRFEVFVYGGRNTLFSWSQMAFVAPVEKVGGGVEGLVLEAGVGGGRGARPVQGSAAAAAGGVGRWAWAVVGVVGVLGCV